MGLLAVGCLWLLPQIRRETRAQDEAQTHVPTARQPVAVVTAGITADSPSPSPTVVGQKAGKPDDGAAPAAVAAEPVDKRWLEGKTLWSSGVSKTAAGGGQRVRLIQSPQFAKLLRVEEAVVAGPDGKGFQIMQQQAMVATQVLMKAVPGVSQERLAAAVRPLGVSILNQIPGSEVFLLSVPAAAADGNALPAAVLALGRLPGIVAYAEPDFIVRATATTPNDPSFSQQWSLNNTGQSGGTAHADIDATDAWTVTTGSMAVIVAVLDSGVDYTHPDLAANIWTNAGEIAGNGIDDDHDGYVDDTLGWNFVSSNNTPQDDNSHGTHVAGIIGAVGNNGTGISGVAWQVKLMPLKFLNNYGAGATSDAISGINYARTKGAHIINNSWGSPTFSQSLKDAFDAAGTAGILNVCAANNGSGTNEDVTPQYPSGFASASIIAVASTNESDGLSYFSDYGPTSVHLGAPGSDIYSTLPGANYGFNSGTSMATPHVSGIAALVKAYRTAITGTDIKGVILASVTHDVALEGKLVTEGRANAYMAVQMANDLGVLPATGVKSQGNRGGPFNAATATYTVKNYRSTAVNWTASLTGAPWASLTGTTSGTLAAGASATMTVTINTTLANAAVAGLQQGALTITDTTTSVVVTRPVTLDVRVPYIYSYDLSTDPGWARTGWWQYGTPTGHGGNTTNPNPDPTSGATGTKVFGANLYGDFATTTVGTFSVTAGPFDLRGYTGTSVQFQRWLNTAGPDNGYHHMEVSTDGGTTWTSLWTSNLYSGVADTAWSLQSYPLGTQSDNQAAVLVRWSYDVPGGAPAASGWNIDDIQINGLPGKRLFLNGVATAAENSGTAALTLHIEPPSSTALTVTLDSSDTSSATLPATVTVPANTSSMTVTATMIDNALRDGTRNVALTPSVANYTTIPWNLAVTDNETAVISLSVPTTITEGQSNVTGTVTLSAAAGRDVQVALTSNNPYAASVPAYALVKSGQTQGAFAITAPQNDVYEGTKSAQITAAVANWTGASATMSVLDDESGALLLSFPLSAGNYNYAEGIPTTGFGGTVSLAAPRYVDTVIAISLNLTNRMSMPAAATIQAGRTSAAITPVTIVDDAIANGVQTVTVTATATGLTNGTASVTVADNEVVSFAFDYIASPQYGGGNQYYNVYALDVGGAVAAGYSGTATISGLNHGTVDPSYNGSTSLTFAGGVANTLYLGYPPVSTSYSIRAVAGTATGTSNSFTVEAAPFTFASLSANEIAYDPVTNRVYASTSSGTVVPINPDTGAMDAPITVSSGAVGQIEIPTSGGILYAAVNNRTQLVKVDLVAKTVGTPFSVGSYNGTALTVRDFAILPNDSNTVGVVLDPQGYGVADHVAIYTNGVKRTTVITYNSSAGSNPVVASQITAGGTANRFYASTGSTYYSLNTLYLLDVSAGGVALNRSYAEVSSLTNLTASGGLVADDTGRIFDGETGNPLGRIGNGNSAGVLLDSTTGRASQIIHTTQNYYDPYALAVYELTGYSETGRYVTDTTPPYSDTSYYPALPSRIVKAGTHTVAYRSASSVLLVKSYLLPDPATAAPDLAVQQMTAPSVIENGKPMSFNILVRNNGSATASNVTLTSDWTPGAVYLGGSTTQGTLTRSGSHLSVSIGTLAAGNAVTVCVRLNGGSNSNRAVVTTTSTEPFTLNNVHSVSTSPGTNYAPFYFMPILGRDMVSSQDLQTVYSGSGFGGGFFAGTLAVMDLSAPAVRAFVPIGSAPGCLALSQDGTTLYVGLDGTGQVVPVNVSTLAPGTAFTLGSAADGRRLFANDMAAMAGSGGNLVIARLDALGAQVGVALFSNGTAVGTATPTNQTMQWVAAGAAGSVCYSYGTDSSGNNGTLYRLDVNGGGVSIAASRSSVSLGRRVGFASGKVLAANGLMYDATTLADAGALVNINTYPYQLPTLTNYDPARERIYALSTASNTPLLAFNSVTYAQTTQYTSSSYSGGGERLVRWGNSGLAFSAANSYGNTPGVYWRDSADLVPNPPLHVNVPATVAENAGVLSGAGTVQLTVAPTSSLTVTLASSNPALLQVPTSVTVPAGQTAVTFNVTLINDSLINGARTVTITPSGPAGYVLTAGTIQVTDDEVGILSLTLPTTATEGAGAVHGQAAVNLVNGPAGGDITIQLSSNRTDKLTVPASVIIPAGQSSAAFDLTLLDDNIIDGTQVVTITASETGWTSANASLNVLDNEATTMTSSLPATIPEGTGYYSVSIYLAGTVLQDTVVSLISSKPAKFSVPATMTIYAGTSNSSFNANVPDDTLKDGRQTVTITATAPGLKTLSQNLIVIDNDLAVMQWGNVPNLTVGDIVPATVTGTTIDGDPAFFGWTPPLLTPTGTQNGSPLTSLTGTLTPAGSTNSFYSNVRIMGPGSNTVLSVSYNGVTASSNAFTVASGPMGAFVWNAIPAGLPQPSTPLSTTVYATDGYGNRLTGYTGTANISAASAAGTTAVTTGGTTPITAAIETSTDQSRMTLLLAPSQINRSGRLRSLSLEVQTPPGRPFTGFLIRGKLTTTPYLSSYWDNSGYTVLRQGALDLTQSKGWVEFPFTTPLDYDGTSYLQIDLSFTTSGTAAGGAYFGSSSYVYNTVGNSANSSQGYGSPETWTTYNPYPNSLTSPNLKLSFGTALTVSPAVTGNFTNGVWTGNVTFSQAASNVVLIASNGTVTGASNAFEVGATPLNTPVVSALPAYSATSSTAITWGAVPTATAYYAEVATDSAFTTPLANSGWITGTTYTFTNLVSGTQYYYHVKAHKGALESSWSSPVNSTQDMVGPTVYVSGLDDGTFTSFTTTRSSITLHGRVTDPAGIAAFSIADNSGITTPCTVNADGTWSFSQSLPSVGFYLNYFTATDQAANGGNITNRYDSITRSADVDNNGIPDDWQTTNGLPINGANSSATGDYDHDGRSNLLEYALNSPPNSSAGNTVPSVANEVKSSDGKTYLVYRYDRRRTSLDLTFGLEFSTDLVTWSATSQQTELIGTPTPNADGVTERVVTRVLPDVTQFAGHKVFVRLKVNTAP